MTNKKSKVVCGRVPHDIAKEMHEQGLSVPECVQIALKSKRDSNVLLKIELRSLLSEQEILASRLAQVNLNIEDIMHRLNIDKSVDELKQEFFIDDNEKAIQTTLERFERARGDTNMTLDLFVNSNRGKHIINVQLSKCDLTEEDFITMLYERYNKSIQTKLDS